MALGKIVRRGAHELTLCLLTLIFLSLLPFIFLFVVFPVVFLRQIAIILSFSDPSIVSILPPRSNLMVQGFSESGPKSNLVLTLHLGGHIPVCKIQDRVKDLLSKGFYPELMYHYKQILGFNFWAKDEKFLIEDHIKIYEEDEDLGEDEFTDVEKLKRKFETRKWEMNKSPWTYQLVHAVGSGGEETSILICGYHHGLCDGFSILNLTLAVSGKEVEEEKEVQRLNSNFSFKGAISALFFPILGLHAVVRNKVEGSDRNALILPEHLQSRNWVGAYKKIPAAVIREVKSVHGVSVSAILFAGLTAAVRGFMKRNELEVPKYVHVLSPFPVPRKEGKNLGNLFSFAYVKLPVGTPDGVERLKEIHRTLENLKTSALIPMNYALIALVGRLNNSLTGLLGKNRYTTGIMSSFPGPSKTFNFLNHKIIGLDFTGGALPGNSGFGASILRYEETFHANLGMNAALVVGQENEVWDMMDELWDEIQMLRHDLTP